MPVIPGSGVLCFFLCLPLPPGVFCPRRDPDGELPADDVLTFLKMAAKTIMHCKVLTI